MNIRLAALSSFTILATLLSGCSFHTVHGNEVGVEENWSTGVVSDYLTPKTYMINPFTTTIYNYPTSGQVFAMNDVDEPGIVNGRRFDALKVTANDNQIVTFHMIVTWRIDPNHVVTLHKEYRDNIEERLIRPEIIKEVTTRATVQSAISIYSGEKYNELRSAVEAALKNKDGKLATSGVIVDSFVMQKPELSPDYEKIIEQRQLAIATESQAKEQQKANEALAEAAKTQADIALNQQVVAAEAAKQVAIKQQEATAQQSIIQTKANADNAVTQQEAESKKVVLAAQAEAQRNIAISEAQKQAEINRAVGIKAVGDAEAYALKLKLTSYAVPGSDLYTRIQVAGSLASALQGVRYYPSNATFSVISGEFDKSLNLLAPTGAAFTTVPAANP